MDRVARLSASDRSELFRAAANLRGAMLPSLIEKDFWVCWTLKRVFTLDDDYGKMREMIFGEVPPFGHILEVLGELERGINAKR